jgi:HAD superfamily hydrolase (TIGR01509 family)
MFSAVIFDWDGTLADTRKAILFSFHKALRELHISVSDEQIERRIGIGAAETFKEILRTHHVSFDDELIRKLVNKKIRAEIEASSEIDLFEGARELLESLKGKVKMALASMNNRKVINHLLETTETRDFFSVTLSVEEISKPKPNPEIFLKCARKLKLKPENCVVVEDSIFGVKAAKAAGMGCIATATGAYSTEELRRAKPDLVVDSPRQKEPIVKFILG